LIAIVGGVIGGVLLLIAIGIIVLVLIVLKRRRRRKQTRKRKQQTKNISPQSEKQMIQNEERSALPPQTEGEKEPTKYAPISKSSSHPIQQEEEIKDDNTPKSISMEGTGFQSAPTTHTELNSPPKQQAYTDLDAKQQTQQTKGKQSYSIRNTNTPKSNQQ
jgi:FtsZ-interacting cell division protein ZipA